MKKYSLVMILLFSLSIMFLCSSVSALESTKTQKQTQTIEKKKYNDSLIRELREVEKKYPLVAKRLGLVFKGAIDRLPLLCIGGIDSELHSAAQDSCIERFREFGQRPDYNYCLAYANRIACRPAKIVIVQ